MRNIFIILFLLTSTLVYSQISKSVLGRVTSVFYSGGAANIAFSSDFGYTIDSIQVGDVYAVRSGVNVIRYLIDSTTTSGLLGGFNLKIFVTPLDGYSGSFPTATAEIYRPQGKLRLSLIDPNVPDFLQWGLVNKNMIEIARTLDDVQFDSHVRDTIVQTNHGFTLGDPIRDSANVKWILANATTPIVAQGVVIDSINADTFVVGYRGTFYVDTNSFLIDTVYYTPDTAGNSPVTFGNKGVNSQELFTPIAPNKWLVHINSMFLGNLPKENIVTQSTYKYCNTGTSCLSDSTYTQIYSTVDTVLLGTPTYNGELRCFDNQTAGNVLLIPENTGITEINGDATYTLPNGQSICFYASPNGPAAWNWYIVSEGSVSATDDNGIISALPNNDVTIQAADHDLRLINIDTLDVQGVNHIKGINSIVIGANGKFDNTGSNGSALLIQPIDAASLVVDNSYPNFWNSSWQDYMVIYKNGSTTYNPTSLPNAYDRRFVRYERYMFHDSTAYRTGLQMRGTLWTNSPNLQAVRLAWYGRQSGATPFVAFNGSSRQVEFPYLSTTTDYYSTNPPGNVTYIGTNNALVNTKPDSILITNPITNSGLITLRSALRTMSLEASSGDNLGNHIATTNIAMAQFDINNANKITSDTVATTNITNLSKAESPTGGTAKSRIIMGTALSIPTSIRTENTANANQYGQLAVDADGITSLIQVNGSQEAGLKIEADSIVNLYTSGNNSIGFVGDTAKVITNNITAIKVGPTGKVEIKDYLLAETTASPAQAEKFAILPVDCSGGAKTVTPPASPVAGDWFAVSDSRANAGTNNITVDTSGDKLHGAVNDYMMNANGQFARFTYVNATVGWIKSN